MGDLNELVERLNSAASIIEQWDAWELGAANKPTVRLSASPSKSIREAAAALTSLIAERDGLREALKPFAMQGWADENGWTDRGCPNDRICDWFGPSDFATALSLDTNKGDGV